MDLLTDTGNHFEKDWRSTAHKDSQLETESDNGKPYAYHAKAQDQEDIWLYENWFYGMKGPILVNLCTSVGFLLVIMCYIDGLIMESGALDGKLFSTSYMFEKFANWTALHVGKKLYIHTDSHLC